MVHGEIEYFQHDQYCSNHRCGRIGEFGRNVESRSSSDVPNYDRASFTSTLPFLLQPGDNEEHEPDYQESLSPIVVKYDDNTAEQVNMSNPVTITAQDGNNLEQNLQFSEVCS